MLTNRFKLKRIVRKKTKYLINLAHPESLGQNAIKHDVRQTNVSQTTVA